MRPPLELLVLGALIGASACASGGVQEDPNWPQACLMIDNREGGGTAGRVMLITPTKERIRIGEVPMGQQKRHCFRRPSISGEYQLLVEVAANDRMDPAQGTAGSLTGMGVYQNQPGVLRSPIFNLDRGTVISWNVRLNQIRLIQAGG